MGYKSLIWFSVLLVGNLALPTPQVDDDLTQFFIHTDPNARIVGGTQAPAGSVPYMVAMTQGSIIRSFFCGGSVISSRTVMTAAHCIDGVFLFGSLSSSLRLIVGTNQWNSGGQSYTVQRNVTHPNYVRSTIKNDVALLITNNNIVQSNVVRPVPISYVFAGPGVEARAAGWGRTSTGGPASSTLIQLTATVIDGGVCQRQVQQVAAQLNMRPPPVESHIEICTFHSAGRGMCNGDSGSALVRTSNQQQIGVVSWGVPCARGAPDMFVRLSAYQNWILSNTV